MSPFTVVVSLEGQFRLDDQPVLHRAAALARGHHGGQLVLLAARPEAQRLRGPHQRRLEAQALGALADQTAALGIPLLCFPQHSTAAALALVAPKLQPDGVLVGEPSRLFGTWPVAREPFPRVFADFRRLINREPEQPVPVPDLTGLGGGLEGWPQAWLQPPRPPLAGGCGAGQGSFPFAGDEASALARLQHYVFGSDGLQRYKATRNQLVGSEFSSKFSPFLAIGSLSVRRIWQVLAEHTARFGETEGCSWMRQELLWREFFLWSAQAHGEAFYSSTGIQGRHQDAEPNVERFRRWTQADSGHPLIDAQLRELNATGYLSNRGRQWVASHFVNSLRLPWTWGARYFEWMLIDADPALNAGNWAYLAGVGSDPRSFGGAPRQFDLEWQAQRYDPSGEHLKRWR
ncbi:MAG: hypothetical protein EBZ76_06890 [Synechococcaceae bacterium WB9_2_170]|nr:hypothetical protein [Synechococcaceae bacterium WB9_2_170]